jgi:hypothetical protein
MKGELTRNKTLPRIWDTRLFFLFVLQIDLELTVKHSQPEGRKSG